MKCPKCGKEIDVDSKYCPYCKCDIEIENFEKIFRIIIASIIGILFIFWLTYSLMTNDYTQIFTNIANIIAYIIGGITLLLIIIFLTPRIKNIVVNVGRFVLDLGTVINVIISVAIIIYGFTQCLEEYGLSVFIWWYIIGAVIFFLTTLLADYTLYLLIDIRDSLKQIINNNNKD